MAEARKGGPLKKRKECSKPADLRDWLDSAPIDEAVYELAKWLHVNGARQSSW